MVRLFQHILSAKLSFCRWVAFFANHTSAFIGYIRVSTEQQDLDKQRHLLLDYAHRQQICIDEFIEVEMSSHKNQDACRFAVVIKTPLKATRVKIQKSNCHDDND